MRILILKTQGVQEMKSSINYKLFALLLLLFFAGVSYSSIFVKLPFSTLVEKSQYILKGKVIDIESQWNPAKTMIQTDVHVQIINKLKGTIPDNTIVVRLPGGHVGHRSIFVEGAPGFQADETVLLFLNKSSTDYLNLFSIGDNLGIQQTYMVSGFAQGKYHIMKDETGKEIAVRDNDDLNFINALTDSLDFDRIDYEKFETMIEELIEKPQK